MAIGKEWTVGRTMGPGEVLLSFPLSALYRVQGLETLLRYRHLDQWSDGTTCHVVLLRPDAREALALIDNEAAQ